MHHARFAHLHVHTEYSLLDGAIRLGDLLAKSKEHRLPAVAVTDHGAMYGTVEFYKAALKAGVKPVFGCEAYVAPGSRFDKRPINGETNYHLILLARNQEGYRNLCRLVTAGYEPQAFYYKPRIDKELLREHASGLIGLSACLKGEVPRALLRGDLNGARVLAEEYASIFGEGHYYFELMENGIPEQRRVNDGLIALGREMGIPVVATNDCHYCSREDARSHEVLVCIQTGKTLHDEKRMKMATDAFYLKSPEEMAEAFSYCPEAVAATVEIAERCNVELDLKHPHFPEYRVPEGETLDDCLDRLAREGLEARLLARRFASSEEEADVRLRYRERLETELKVIRDMQFPGYFLIVQDFINWSKENGVPVGPGRGSAAGSLVAYALRITNIDPIPYDLLFERFLNPERVSLPDIDVDFCFENREKAIAYVTRKYGADRVAQITTFGKMLARAVIRDVGRVLDLPYAEVDRIAKLVPAELKITLRDALEKEPRLREAVEQDQRVAELIEHAKRLEGLNRHASTHAAGIVIANRPLVDYLPVYRGKNGEAVTQFAMKSVEDIGLIKFDFLGLKTLTVIQDALRHINSRRPAGEALDIDAVPLDDPAVYELLSRGETTGVFQLESSGMRELMVQLKPSVFGDIVALVALYRPGPMQMIPDFIGRKHGTIPIEYELPQLQPILKDTYGVIVYQEQVMQIAQVLADYSLGEADLLRRAMGKKIAEEMDKQKNRFLEGAKRKGIDPVKADRIFELMAKFAEYGFNKSHAAAYALITYQTAYLKAHHRVEFLAALLTNDRANTDDVVKDIAECRAMGVPVLPPDVNESGIHFTVVGGTSGGSERAEAIRFGLAAVKNVGENALQSVLGARKKDGPFRGLLDFCERVDLQKVNRKVIESLIRCGAFDSLGGNRAQYLAYLDRALERAAAAQRDRARGQTNLFDLLAGPEEVPGVSADDLPDLPPLPAGEELRAEKEVLGMFLSGHPLGEWSGILQTYTDGSLLGIVERPDRTVVTVGGVVAALKVITNRAGNRMAFVTLEDTEGTLEVVVFAEAFAKAESLLHSETPLIVRGVLERSEDTGKILAEEILPVSEAPERLTQAVHIHLNAGLHGRGDLQALRRILAAPEHRGSAVGYVHVLVPQKAEAVIRLPASLGLRASTELRKEVAGLMGTDGAITFH
ncbi:MAG: DNA polymerase III subunit alpha [Deferrisomatales bacterium]|nr:DNA polymerase III subunit alpha [Deferrisomatales bacterium]